MIVFFLYWLGELLDRLAAHRHRAVVPEDMPGHPERVGPIGDVATDTAFWDAAEALLDDPREPDLSEVNDRWGWIR